MSTIIILYAIGVFMSGYLASIIKKKGYEYGSLYTTVLSWFGFILLAYKFTKAEGTKNE